MSFFWIALIVAVLAILIICASARVDDYLFRKYYADNFRKYKRYKDLNNTVTVVTVMLSILICSFIGAK